MQYFKHFGTMRHDIKIKRVISKFGLEGYGLYNLTLESITESLSTPSPLPDLQETCEDIAEFYNGNTAKINEMMNFMVNQGLFDLDEMTGSILCNKLYKFLDTSQTRSTELRAMIKGFKKVSTPQIEDMSNTVSDGHEQVVTKNDKSDRKEEEKKKNKKENKSSRFTPDLDFILDVEMAMIFDKWCKGKSKKYKNQIQVEAGYNKLSKLSDGSFNDAIEIVNNSLAGNWEGLFELKDKDRIPKAKSKKVLEKWTCKHGGAGTPSDVLGTQCKICGDVKSK